MVSGVIYQRFPECRKPERKALHVFITRDVVIEIIFLSFETLKTKNRDI